MSLRFLVLAGSGISTEEINYLYLRSVWNAGEMDRVIKAKVCNRKEKGDVIKNKYKRTRGWKSG